MSFKISLLFVFFIFYMLRHETLVQGGFRTIDETFVPSGKLVQKRSWRPPRICYYELRHGTCAICINENNCKNQTQYWFNMTGRTCVPFIFAGCGGNENRFDNYRACFFQCTNIIRSDENIPYADNFTLVADK